MERRSSEYQSDNTSSKTKAGAAPSVTTTNYLWNLRHNPLGTGPTNSAKAAPMKGSTPSPSTKTPARASSSTTKPASTSTTPPAFTALSRHPVQSRLLAGASAGEASSGALDRAERIEKLTVSLNTFILVDTAQVQRTDAESIALTDALLVYVCLMDADHQPLWTQRLSLMTDHPAMLEELASNAFGHGAAQGTGFAANTKTKTTSPPAAEVVAAQKPTCGQ